MEWQSGGYILEVLEELVHAEILFANEISRRGSGSYAMRYCSIFVHLLKEVSDRGAC
jgi:hypothetical protein